MTIERPRRLVIGWLYGKRMNIYGDRGNVLTLARRAEWRGIDAEIREIGHGAEIPRDVDIFFWGGGQDQEQAAAAQDMEGEKGRHLRAAIDGGAAMLAICGGYQLLGRSYRTGDGEELPGIGLFDMVTTAGPDRRIGNIVVKTERWGTLVGFENHSGLTYLNEGVAPLGRVEVGHGNNGRDGTEGAIYQNAIGCYVHGALLPRHPSLADWLLACGLRHRYGEADLAPLDDAIELRAHEAAIRRAGAAM